MTDLLVIAPTLTPGGIYTHVRCLAQGAAHGSASITVVSGTRGHPGPSVPGAAHERLDLLTRAGVGGVQAQIRQSKGILLIYTPETYHLIGLLAEATAAAVGVHGTPGTNANWLGVYRHTIAAASIQALPRLPLLVPGERYRGGIADEFALPVDRVQALPNAIDTLIDPNSAAGSAGILLACRLDNDKAWLLDAAIDLAEASSRPLRVVGGGLHADEWRDRLTGRCRTPWTLIETSDLTSHIAKADVVVAAGLVAMEATAAGRRVVIPSKTGGWLGAVTPATLAQMREANFVAWGSAPVTDAGTVWAAATALSDASLRSLVEAVREECSPTVMHGRLGALLRSPGTLDPLHDSVAALEIIAECERDQQKVRADFAAVLEAKEYFQRQATNWENAYREVQPQVDAEEAHSGPEPTHSSWRDRLSGAARWAYASRHLHVHTLAAGAHFAKKEVPARVRVGPAQRHRTTVRRSASIPDLAWLAKFSRDAWECVIGPQVEVLPGGFYEGVWDSDFGDFPPTDSEFAFGTGVYHAGRRPLFMSSRNPSQVVFVLRRNDDAHVFVSNSLTFALTAAEVRFEGPFVEHLSRTLRPTIQTQSALGVYKAPTILHEDENYRLDAVTFFDFHVSDEGAITRRWRRPHRYFSDFASHQRFMESTLRRLIDNARSAGREVPLHPLVLLSRGYDSVASAVLGKRAGVTDACTLAVSVDGRPDSGLHIAQKLYLRCSVHEHVIGRDVAGLDFNVVGPLRNRALEFLTEGGVGLDLMMLPFADQMRSGVVLTGQSGDTYYERDGQPLSGFQRHVFGGPYNDFRLRVGCAFIPVPLLGMRFTPPVIDLNRSPEMEPFSVGGSYDRPVLRRIGEEAGLPRSDFGSAKTATAPQLLNAGEAFGEAISTISERYREWRRQ